MNTNAEKFDAALRATRVVAILRGLPTNDAVEVVGCLADMGVRIVEVPLNSPDPLATIGLLCAAFGDRLIIGAGTVTRVSEVEAIAACGARICVSPNTDGDVIRAALALGLIPLPGFRTPSEAFEALAAGAQYLKVFPASEALPMLAPLAAVLPKEAVLIGVGGVGPEKMRDAARAGCTAFGVGSELYKPGRTLDELRTRAAAAMAAAGKAMRPEATVLAAVDAIVGESPTFLHDRGELVWVDPVRRVLHSYAVQGASTKRVNIDTELFGLAVTNDSRLIATAETELREIDPDTGRTSLIASASLPAGCRFNDLIVDDGGGVWAGTMHRGLLAGKGAIFHHAPGAPLLEIARGLGVCNGMDFSPDGTTLYVIDTLARHLLAYAVDAASGTLGEPVIVTDFMGVAGKPDGIAVDADGGIWVAMWGGAQVVRVCRDGTIDRTVSLPAPQVSSVAIVNNHVFVTTSRMRLSDQEIAAYPLSGALFEAFV